MRPAFEKPALRKVSPTRDADVGQSHTQSPFPTSNAASALGTTQMGRPRPVAQPAADDFQQNMPRSQAQPMTPRRPAPNNAGANMRGASRPPMTGAGAPTRQPTGPNAQVKSMSQPLNARPLTPGAQLRGNRYRLQELMERQDWLSGVFEAVWIGRDSQRVNQDQQNRENHSWFLAEQCERKRYHRCRLPSNAGAHPAADEPLARAPSRRIPGTAAARFRNGAQEARTTFADVRPHGPPGRREAARPHRERRS